MNQKNIWLIVGLLTVAVIGVMSLQLKFILDSRTEKITQFRNDVRNALKTVSDRIERSEDMVASRYLNGYSIQQSQRTPNGVAFQSSTVISSQPLNSQERVVAAKIKEELFFNLPFDERLDLDIIQRYLKQELPDIDYSYGVYSKTANSFVLYNNHFILPNENQTAYNIIKNSPYKVDLFVNDLNGTPGYLAIYFPTENSYIWAGLWGILLLSLLFVGVILACFAYTIFVIYRQKKLSEMKNDFINNMTHEFKTPIATISLAADSITNQNIINNPDKIKRFADIIRQENKRMNGQVEKVLQMALIERDKLNLNISEINIHEVITQALNNISLQVEKKEGVVSSHLKAERAVIEGDANHVSNVINNLLDNANKYSPEKPDITISTRNISNGLEITVADKGIGMTKEAKKKIFEKFYRVHTGNVHDVKGFGLGLAYVKAMVTAHQGSIDVKSEPSKGSSFIIFLPFHVTQDLM
jgi:two-component system, OmpR family, phosphate regulon sensor histidine kinase PhoR